MKPIDKKFSSHGFDFEQVARMGRVAVYRKQKGVRNISFETVVLQRVADRTWPDGTTTPAHEAMPSDEQWGTYGFSYRDEASALAKCKTLHHRHESGSKPYLRSNAGHSCDVSQVTLLEVAR
jgi:hypothetical protein